MFFKEAVDTVSRIEQLTDRTVMIQRINNQRNVFAHIHAGIIGLGQKLRALVHQVGSKNPVNDPFLMELIKSGKTVGEKAECREDKYLSGLSPL